jgi:hypothetical protein
MNAKYLTVASAALALAACGDSTDPEKQAESGIAISVNALELSGVTDACYSLSTVNANGEQVWSAADICSSAYGDGRGSISYVGPCDASTNPNTVALTLNSLTDDAGNPIPETDYQNPCPAGGPCELQVVCQENVDVPVVFNLTILRDLGAGFLDVAINFDEVLCSAKVDCAYADGSTIDLVPFQGVRQPSVVSALACGGAAATALYRDPIVLDCGTDGTFTIDPSASGEIPGVVVWQTFTGTSGPVSAAPLTFWNVAFAMAPGFDGTCTLKSAATAATGSNPQGTIGAGHPVLLMDVPVFAGSSTPACGQNPLGAVDSGVQAELSKGERTFSGVYAGE